MMPILPGQSVIYGNKEDAHYLCEEKSYEGIVTAVQDSEKGIVDLQVTFPMSQGWNKILEIKGVPFSETIKEGHWSKTI